MRMPAGRTGSDATDLGLWRARTRPSKQLARGCSAPRWRVGQQNWFTLSANWNLPVFVSTDLCPLSTH